MTIPNFKSALSACLTDFIGYKQALNCKYRTEASVLQMLDQYLCDHNIPYCEAIDSTVIEGFLKSAPDGRELQPFARHNAHIFRMGSPSQVH